MIDVLDEFRGVRPDAARFDQHDAERLWVDTFGSEAAGDRDPHSLAPDVAWTHTLQPVTALDRDGRQHDDRRTLAWLGSAAAVIALVVGVVFVAGRPSTSDTGVSEPGPTEADAPVIGDPSPASEWMPFPTMPIEPRFQYSAVSTGTGIFVWGGCCANGSSSDNFHDGAYFDGATQTWTVLPDAPLDPTRGDAVTGWNGSEVVVINGIDGVTAAAFDPAAFTWRSITPPDAETATNGGSRLQLLADGRLAFVSRLSVSYWDPAADTWSPPHADTSFDIDWENSDAATMVGTHASTPTSIGAITLGSWDDCASARIRTFDSTTETWSATMLPSNDAYPTDIVGIDGGRFLLSGASPCDPASPPRTEQSATIFDPADGSFTPVAELAATQVSSRYGGIWNGNVAMWLLENGQILSYRPATDEWLAGQSLLDASPNSGDLISETPLIWFDDHVVVVSPGWGRFGSQVTNPGGWSCCFPTRESWSAPTPTAPVTAIAGVGATDAGPGSRASASAETTTLVKIGSGTVLVANAAGVPGLGGNLSAVLQEFGLTLAAAANADPTADPDRTVIYARPGHEQLAAAVADLLGLGPWEPMPTTLPVDDLAIAPEDVAVLVVAGIDLVDRLDATTAVIGAPSVGPPGTACVVPGSCATYIVRRGDYPAGVAEKFCITVAELVAANGWPDATTFPGPDVAIVIPPDDGRPTCPSPTS